MKYINAKKYLSYEEDKKDLEKILNDEFCR
jgi:hypothetical protein